MLDNKLFKNSISGLCEMFERQATDALLDIYYQALSDLTDEQFSIAIAAVIRGKKFNKLPLPGEIRDDFGGGKSAALLALDKAEKAIEKHGSYVAVVFDDPIIHMVIRSMGGWPQFCCPSAYGDCQDWQWKQKEFVALYEVFVKNSRAECPPVLVGLGDMSYERNGEVIQIPPAYVGDEQKAMAWSQREHLLRLGPADPNAELSRAPAARSPG